MRHEPLTIFSWGYWGWGTSAIQFVKLADAVEAARGFGPPFFVDIRLRRSGRAVDFSGRAFEDLVGTNRYLWMDDLGNVAIADPSLGRLKIKNPKAAESLLDLALDYAKDCRHTLFYCACEVPRRCHRWAVGGLLLRAAKRRGIAVEVVEWPGGEPTFFRQQCPEEALRKLTHGGKSMLLGARPNLAALGAVAWGSVAELADHPEPLAAVVGPAVFARRAWHLPLAFGLRPSLNRWGAMQDGLSERRRLGYASRTVT